MFLSLMVYVQSHQVAIVISVSLNEDQKNGFCTRAVFFRLGHPVMVRISFEMKYSRDSLYVIEDQGFLHGDLKYFVVNGTCYSNDK